MRKISVNILKTFDLSAVLESINEAKTGQRHRLHYAMKAASV